MKEKKILFIDSEQWNYISLVQLLIESNKKKLLNRLALNFSSY